MVFNVFSHIALNFFQPLTFNKKIPAQLNVTSCVISKHKLYIFPFASAKIITRFHSTELLEKSVFSHFLDLFYLFLMIDWVGLLKCPLSHGLFRVQDTEATDVFFYSSYVALKFQSYLLWMTQQPSIPCRMHCACI